jgi:hypothetical protein
MLVTGKTGAGKSFPVADLILQQRRVARLSSSSTRGTPTAAAELLGGQSVRLGHRR